MTTWPSRCPSHAVRKLESDLSTGVESDLISHNAGSCMYINVFAHIMVERWPLAQSHRMPSRTARANRRSFTMAVDWRGVLAHLAKPEYTGWDVVP